MYKTIEDKSKVFAEHAVNTAKELQILIDNIGGKSTLRYRGVCEAKYTMLTSLQRKCPAKLKGRQKDYMGNLLNDVKTNQDVKAYFKEQNIPINDISCMSLMQHSGLPTPMLDFSIDINVALSFASDGVSLVTSNDEIDDYVSLYVIDLDVEKEVAASMQQIYQHGMESGKQKWKDFITKHPNMPVDVSILYDINKFVRWSDVKDIELLFVEYQPLAPKVKTLLGDNLDLTNPNLSNQKGCFIINLYDETMPLEENWNMRLWKRINDSWQSGSGAQTLQFSGVHTSEKILCYDIKKEVILEWATKNKLQLYINDPAIVAIRNKLQNIYVQFGGVIGAWQL